MQILQERAVYTLGLAGTNREDGEDQGRSIQEKSQAGRVQHWDKTLPSNEFWSENSSAT